MLHIIRAMLVAAMVTATFSAQGASLPSAPEAHAACEFVASQPDGIGPLTIQTGSIDANNDGIEEMVGGPCLGSDNCPRRLTVDGDEIAYESVGFEWKDFWTYGFGWMRLAGRTYGLHAKDDGGRYASHLTYLASDNREHLVCIFANSVDAYLLPADRAHAEMCRDLAAGRVEFVGEASMSDVMLTRLRRAETHLEGHSSLDADNDGLEKQLARFLYGSGAGRGCVSEYYDVWQEPEAEPARGSFRDLLLRLQGVDFDGKIPGRCGGNRPRWFRHEGVNYLQIKFRGEQPNWPIQEVWWAGVIANGAGERVCDAMFTVDWRTCAFGPAFDPEAGDQPVPTECPTGWSGGDNFDG